MTGGGLVPDGRISGALSEESADFPEAFSSGTASLGLSTDLKGEDTGPILARAPEVRRPLSGVPFSSFAASGSLP